MIRLGEAWLSMERREAFLHGEPVRLGSRAFSVLEMLLAAPNRLVTKDELIDAIWPDTVVEENNLQVQISTLRRVLQLDQRVLETVPRRGYRLNICSEAASLALVSPPDDDDTWKSLAHVHVVDDEPAVCAALVRLLRAMGIAATGHASAAAFLAECVVERPACLLLDVRLNEGSGFDLLDELTRRQAPFPIVFMTGFGTIDMSVRAMKAGALGFLTKPVNEDQLLCAVREAIERAHTRHAESTLCRSVCSRYACLTERERQIFACLIRGHQNKQIAADLGLQEVTVKVHKKHIMTKLGARTLVDLLMVGRVLGMLPDFHPQAEPA
ncbi:response regulator [Pseudomonas sp. BMS12]|uniref:response regulator n=1 Tax=Pseudomonas sp. BMS12 TaxID=1796033 RepID=UPI00083A4C95|nr:response regulator [Pseudomonas sp. BMS12]